MKDMLREVVIGFLSAVIILLALTIWSNVANADPIKGCGVSYGANVAHLLDDGATLRFAYRPYKSSWFVAYWWDAEGNLTRLIPGTRCPLGTGTEVRTFEPFNPQEGAR